MLSQKSIECIIRKKRRGKKMSLTTISMKTEKDFLKLSRSLTSDLWIKQLGWLSSVTFQCYKPFNKCITNQPLLNLLLRKEVQICWALVIIGLHGLSYRSQICMVMLPSVSWVGLNAIPRKLNWQFCCPSLTI